jgi:SAM-dependent methyltransferase
MPTAESASEPLPQGGYPADAFSRIAAVQRGNYWFESRNRLIVWAIRRYFPGARTFLDVGCGTGYVLEGLHEAFPRMHLAGTDFLEEGLSFARARVPSATFFRSDAHNLVVPEPVDVAGSFDVLEHIPDDLAVLRRIHAAIRPGGGLLIAVPQHRWLWSSADDQAQHVRRYRRDEMLDRVRAAGFDVVRATSFISLLLPLMALSRWRDARRTRGPQASELMVGRPLNAALRGVLTVERSLVRAGVSFPAGGSLLVVARRR